MGGGRESAGAPLPTAAALTGSLLLGPPGRSRRSLPAVAKGILRMGPSQRPASRPCRVCVRCGSPDSGYCDSAGALPGKESQVA